MIIDTITINEGKSIIEKNLNLEKIKLKTNFAKVEPKIDFSKHSNTNKQPKGFYLDFNKELHNIFKQFRKFKKKFKKNYFYKKIRIYNSSAKSFKILRVHHKKITNDDDNDQILQILNKNCDQNKNLNFIEFEKICIEIK